MTQRLILAEHTIQAHQLGRDAPEPEMAMLKTRGGLFVPESVSLKSTGHTPGCCELPMTSNRTIGSSRNR